MISTNVRIIYQLDKLCFSPLLLQTTFAQTAETSFMTFFATIFILLVVLVFLYVKFPSVQQAVGWAAAGQQIAAAKDEVISVKDQLIKAKDKQIERNDRDIDVNSKAVLLDLALSRKIIIMELQSNTAPLPPLNENSLKQPITGNNGLYNPSLPLNITPPVDVERVAAQPILDGYEAERDAIEVRLKDNIDESVRQKYTVAVTTKAIILRKRNGDGTVFEEIKFALFQQEKYFSPTSQMYFLGCGYSKCNAIILTENKEKKYCCDKNHKTYASQERTALAAANTQIIVKEDINE